MDCSSPRQFYQSLPPKLVHHHPVHPASGIPEFFFSTVFLLLPIHWNQNEAIYDDFTVCHIFLKKLTHPPDSVTHSHTRTHRHTHFFSFYWSARSLRMHSSWKRVPCLTRLLFGRHWLFVCVISFFIRPLARCSLVKYPRKQWNPPSSHFFRTVKWSTCAPFSEVRRRVKLIFVPHPLTFSFFTIRAHQRVREILKLIWIFQPRKGVARRKKKNGTPRRMNEWNICRF